MAKFEVVSKYADAGLTLPVRKTEEAAGYDIQVAEDTLIPPYAFLMNEIVSYVGIDKIDDPITLDDMAKITKAADAKITLVPTGVKCKLEKGTYLELSVRSSTPLKNWLILGNSVGIIDGDYYNNEDNEGHIFFQIINLSPLPIILKKGDTIGQGIIKEYIKTEDDIPGGVRKSGFGSTDEQKNA